LKPTRTRRTPHCACTLVNGANGTWLETPKEKIMDYLFIKLLWYILLAFAIGMFVGWFSCGRAED
jgi:hypothetical protein